MSSLASPATTVTQDSRAFRHTLGKFATGITVITTLDAAQRPVGLTANSFNAVSLDPALIVWSLSRDMSLRDSFENCAHYAINVLANDQEAVSRRFSSKVTNRFADQTWHAGQNGMPLLDGCCAHFEVRNYQRHDGGDHILFIGAVSRFVAYPREPLLYFDGQYRQLSPQI